jgi:dolichol-phosphate mannosyltransferase
MRAPDLAVIVPVLNERDNVAPLVDRLLATLTGRAIEIVFVDDGSTDGTRDAVAAIGREDTRIRLIHRRGRRGLASAFIEGAESSLAPCIAAIDGDLQHDETLLPAMHDLLLAGAADIVVGSRHAEGGSLGEWNRTRAGMSDFATRASRLILRAPLTDPMSGFFMLTRETYERAAPRLSALGFKILLDVLTALPAPPRIAELPYTFRNRVAGDSKLDAGVLFDFALMLLDKRLAGLVPARFVLFAAIGLLGLAAHLLVLRAGLAAGLAFGPAQAIATIAAIAGNFALNNTITFRDRKLRGARLLRGFAVFALACAPGAVANLDVASLMVSQGHDAWWVGGVLGAAMSLVWNYAVGSTLTWRR